MTNDKQTDRGLELAQHIAEAIKGHPHAEIRVNPTIHNAIPAHIAKNILEFLLRVQTTGMEAVAWVEAYQHVQQHIPQEQAQQPQPGIPFGGLPATTPKAV
jgi:hypothetical protein